MKVPLVFDGPRAALLLWERWWRRVVVTTVINAWFQLWKHHSLVAIRHKDNWLVLGTNNSALSERMK